MALKVLIVDDSDVMRKVVKRVLGYVSAKKMKSSDRTNI